MLFYFKMFGGAELISYKNLCFAYKANKMQGGISLGNFAFLGPGLSLHKPTVAHEQLGHTVDSKIFGPMYLFVIGIPSMIHAMNYKCPCYYDFFTEQLANYHAKLEVDRLSNGRCYLRFKEERPA